MEISKRSADYQPSQVLRLVTLGGLAATGADGAPLATSPPRRRLALLAMVAASGDMGISRDKLLFYFWPEGSEERSRHALTQTLYALRRDMGGAEIIAGSSELRLARNVMISDVGELKEAFDAGDSVRATTLYTGPFLDGVFLPGLPDFERWMEEERSSIARRASAAIESLAESAEQSGDAAAAERWWRRLATLDPLNGRYALRLMEALAALGDRVGAIRHARVHEALVSQELGGHPDPAVTVLAARLREAPSAAAASAPTRAPTAEGAGALSADPATPSLLIAPATLGARGAWGGGGGGGGGGAPSDDDPRSRFRGPRRWAAIAGGTLAAVAVIGYAAVRTPPVSGALARESDQVLVTDVENSTGDSVFDRSVPVALSAGLLQTNRVSLFSRTRVRETLALMGRQDADTIVDESLGREIAQRAGVRLLVVPAIARFDSTYVLTARVVDASTGEVADIESARANGRSEILHALDDISRALRRSFGETILSLHRRTVPLPLATTGSLEALKLYADGLLAFNSGEYASAITLYRAALARDSNFAMAHASLGAALYWTNDRPGGEQQFQRALALMDRLSDREKFLVRAQVAGWRGDRKGQITILSAFLLRYPNDAGARSQLAYAYLRARRYREARDLYLEILAVDSTDASDIINLATSYNGLDEPEHAVEAYHRAFALDPSFETGSTLNIEYGGALVKSGRIDEARATFHKMLTLQPAEQARGHRSLSYLESYQGHFAAAAQELAEAILIDRVLGYKLSESRDRLRRSLIVSSLGDDASARAELDEVWKIFRQAYLEPTMLLWIGKAEARSGNLLRAKELLDSLQARANANSSSDQSAENLLSAEIAMAEGRYTEAQPRIALALTLDSTRYVLESAAYGAERSGNITEAERLYTALGSGTEFGWEGQRGWELAPYQLGLIEERLGNTAAAQAAYRQLVARWPDGDPDLGVLADARRRLGLVGAESAERQ